jgi:DNA-binding response OmpR family regulator
MCILLVEDESLIRLIVAEELTESGFKVCEAESGDEAAALIATTPAGFSLLVTDIHMPGTLDGIELAHLMRTHYPDIPIIYMTGRPGVLNGLGRLGSKEALVPKPFAPSDLLATVRRLLAELPPPPATMTRIS